jgi:hypothetical protein
MCCYKVLYSTPLELSATGIILSSVISYVPYTLSSMLLAEQQVCLRPTKKYTSQLKGLLVKVILDMLSASSRAV